MPSLSQTIISHCSVPRSISYQTVSLAQDVTGSVQQLVQSAGDVIGVSVRLGDDGAAEAAAFSGVDFILVIDGAAVAGYQSPPDQPGRNKAVVSLAGLLSGSTKTLTGFSMARMAAAKENWSPGKCLEETFGTLSGSYVNEFAVNSLWDSFVSEDYRTMCWRAWVTARVGNASSWIAQVETSPRVYTSMLKHNEFNCVYKMIAESELMHASQPTFVENDFSGVSKNSKGNLVIDNERYKTRVRMSSKTKTIFTGADGSEHSARIVGAAGKKTEVQAQQSLHATEITRIRVVGKQELTGAERARERLLTALLQGRKQLYDDSASSLVRLLWFPKQEDLLIEKFPVKPSSVWPELNASQATAALAMLSSKCPFVVVHGPPGTGKTSTIAAAVKVWDLRREPVWIVAQSNVGVKNIAEKLFKNDVKFKLLVSKEFYVEWHEHIYERIQGDILRSDEFPKDLQDVQNIFYGVNVVLCTLSMLSNPALPERHVFEHVPMERLVVDEASQIGVFEYMHLFIQFRTSLLKVCFFGDPKQLPPYGKDAAPTLQCIFDIKHLKPSAYFLDTSYRMPTMIGDFISEAVYDSKLKSVHNNQSPGCVKFIDVDCGEEERAGQSWKNAQEVVTVGNLVRHYYRKREFCIITPYDAQRNAIQAHLKQQELPWEQVYNVDSFQGNEAKSVIVSIARTGSAGFLKFMNRVNVMLTRCTEGMIIVSQKDFLTRSDIQKTLIGQMAAHWKGSAGEDAAWCDWRDVVNERIDLPGSPGRKNIPQSVLRPLASHADYQATEYMRARPSPLLKTTRSQISPVGELRQNFPFLPSSPGLVKAPSKSPVTTAWRTDQPLARSFKRLGISDVTSAPGMDVQKTGPVLKENASKARGKQGKKAVAVTLGAFLAS